MDQIFQPAKWLPDWFRDWATRLLRPSLERREAPRRTVANLTAHYWDGIGAGHVVGDISASGAFILADFKWTPGTILTMTLHWEGKVDGSVSAASVVVEAMVVRHAQSGIGVRFLYSDKRERESVAKFLQSIPVSHPS